MPAPAFWLLSAALGAREGITRRRNRNTLLAREAERQTAINDIPGINPFGANSFEDAQQLENLAQQHDTAIAMMKTTNPALVQEGMKQMGAVRTAHRQFLAQNEVQARADEVRRQDHDIAIAGAGRGRNEAALAKADVTNEKIHADIRPYINAKVGFDKVQNLLAQDNQLATLAGLTAFVQGIDNSVVRPSELQNYSGTNGLITQLSNILNKAEGRDWDEQTKQDILNASAGLLNSEKGRAAGLVETWQDRIGLRPEIDAERALAGVDTNLFTPIPIQTTPAPEPEPGVAGRLEEVAEPGNVGGALAAGVRSASEIWQSSNRALQGIRLDYDPDTKKFWEVDIETGRILGEFEPNKFQQDRADIDSRAGVELTPSARRRHEGIEAERKRVEDFERRLRRLSP